MGAVLGLVAAPFLIAMALLIAATLGRAKARRLNRQRQEAYLDECLAAKRCGLPPPPPPNTIRWG